MKKITSIATAVCVVATGFGTMGVSAAEYTVTGYPNRDKCYLVEHIPATYNINTKGIKVKGETKSWSGTIAAGNVVTHRKNPAVYIRTKKLVEADHYSLVSTSC